MGSSTFMVLLAVTTILVGFQAEAAEPDTKVYIVFVKPNKGIKPLVLLQSVFESLSESPVASRKHATEALTKEYEHMIGFAALLSKREAQKLSETPGVLDVFPSRMMKIDDPIR